MVPCSAGRYPLEALLEDCRAYVKTTGRRPTFEYTLLAGINDSIAQVCRLLGAVRFAVQFAGLQEADVHGAEAEALS